MSTLEQAYAHCEEVTHREARNFYYGIRLLPPAKRQAMCAVYAMSRHIDDIGDGDLPRAGKLSQLAATRARLAGAAGDDDPVLVALYDAAHRFPIPMEAFGELITGCEMDAGGTTYETFGQLVDYCRLVAGSIGRLSVGVFGALDVGLAMSRADDLGVAFQVTNILRDLIEDRETLGRVYLPREDVTRFGLGPDLAGRPGDVADLVRFEATQARPFWDEGLRLLPLLDRRSRACVAAMAGIYSRLLARIERRPAAVLQTRLALPGWEKAWVATRALTGAGT